MPVPRIMFVIEDDCLAPEARLKIEYSGPNPFKIAQTAREILRRVLEVEAQDFWERDFRWDITSDPRAFFVKMYVNRGIDSRSRAFIEVSIQGLQPTDPTKSGKVTVYVGGKLRTEYTLETAFQHLPVYKGLIWLYQKVFYNRIRRDYMRMCVTWIEKVTDEFRNNLGISSERLV